MSVLDPHEFAKKQFASSVPFDASIDIVATYATDVPMVVEGSIDAIAPQGEVGRFCEIGFGSGWLMAEFARRFPKARLFGLDLSEEFCERAHACLPTAAIARGDMEALPFRDRAFDCVASCCALYFARDIGRALSELARVSSHRVVIAHDNLRELDEFSRQVLSETTLEDIASRFDLEAAWPLVKAEFPGATRVDWRGSMRLPSADHLVKYWSGFHHQELAEQGSALLEFARRLAPSFAAADGSVTITRSSGAFIADL